MLRVTRAWNDESNRLKPTNREAMPSMGPSSAAFQARPMCVRVVRSARDVSGDLQAAGARSENAMFDSGDRASAVIRINRDALIDRNGVGDDVDLKGTTAPDG